MKVGVGAVGPVGAVAVAWMAIACCSFGCAHRAEGPSGTLAAFGAALARGDLKAAYALTSADLHQRMPYEAFAAVLSRDPGEGRTLGKRLVAAAPGVAPRVEIALDLGEIVPLVLEDGRWRIDGPVFEPWGQQTPRAALGTFIRALDERRYDVLLRLVPDRYRGDLTAETLRQYWEQERRDDHVALLGRLRAAAGAPIVESGDEAHMPAGPDQEVRFVREGGQWKIEAPE